MPHNNLVHIVATASAERAEQARVCYTLGIHAEIYGNYDELVAVAPARGFVLAQDIADRGGIAALIGGMVERDFWLPVVATAADPEPTRVVAAVKAGALEYLALPLHPQCLMETLLRAEHEAETSGRIQRQAAEARARLARLTLREREVLELLVGGASNKVIARDLRISPRTVEIHRAHMMAKLGAQHAADAVRMRLEASMGSGFARQPLMPSSLAA